MIDHIASAGPYYPANKLSLDLGNLINKKVVRWVDFHIKELRPFSIELILEDSNRFYKSNPFQLILFLLVRFTKRMLYETKKNLAGSRILLHQNESYLAKEFFIVLKLEITILY